MDMRFGPLRKLNGSFEASISKISLEYGRIDAFNCDVGEDS